MVRFGHMEKMGVEMVVEELEGGYCVNLCMAKSVLMTEEVEGGYGVNLC